MGHAQCKPGVMKPAKSLGKEFLYKAEKKFGSSVGWFSSSATKFEEAGDLYQQAANNFKIEKSFGDAGDAYAKEAECRERCEEHGEAANAWWNAAKAFKEAEKPGLAIEALKQAVLKYQQAGRFRQAADRLKDTAEIYELILEDYVKAAQNFEQAAGLYEGDDAKATATGLNKRAAEQYAKAGKFSEAARLYEKVISRSTDSLARYGIKDLCLSAFLCLLAEDQVTAKMKLGQYNSENTFFINSREAMFAKVIMDSVDAGDVDAFEKACLDFNNVAPMDSLKVHILLSIKKQFESEPSLT